MTPDGPPDDARLDLLETRADYIIETEDNGRVSAVSAYAVKELVEEVRRLRRIIAVPPKPGAGT
jgi:hypothetical protein